MKKNIALIIIYLLVCVQLHAQLIKGKVVDEHNVPMPLVNVALLSEGDSTLIKGVVTDKDGVFNIERFFIGYVIDPEGLLYKCWADVDIKNNLLVR